VILVSVFLSLILALTAVTEASSYWAAGSYAASVFSLGEVSVLSCYQKELYERYGIFGFHSDKETLETMVKNYASASFREDRSADRMVISLDSVTLYPEEFSLCKGDTLKKNMAECMKRQIPLEVLDWLGFQDALAGVFAGKTEGTASKGEGSEGNQASGGDGTEEDPYGFRTLRNSSVIELLPSVRKPAEGALSTEIKLPQNLDDLVSNSITEVLANLYVLSYFSNYTTELQERTTFFRNEAEYVIAGEYSDEANLREVQGYLTLLRTGLNALQIAEDPAKLEATMVLAAAISGPGAIWTQAAIVAGWAAAEALCDVSRLMQGKKVPIWKTEADWSLSIEGLRKWLVDGIEPETGDNGTEDTGKGLSYAEYLAILLFLTGSNLKLTRVMDLIQINLCGSSDGSFDLSRCYSGFRISCIWRQRERAFLPLNNQVRRYENTVTYFP